MSRLPSGQERLVEEKRRERDRQRESVGFEDLGRFLGFTLPYWRWLAAGALTAVWRMILPLFMPLFLWQVIDLVVNAWRSGEKTRAESEQMLWTMITVFLIIAGAHSLVTLGRFYFPQVAIARAVRDLRFKLYSHLQRLSLGFHAQRPTGGIVARVIHDVQVCQQSIEAILIVTLQQAVHTIVIACILLWMDWQWALVAFATLPFFVITSRVLRTRMRRASREVAESIERMSGRVHERMGMIREVQAFTAEDEEGQAVLDEAERWKQHTLRQRMLNGFLVGSSEITRYSALAVVMAFGVYRMFNAPDRVTEGMLAGFYMYTNQALNPLQFFANMYGQLHRAAAAADRIFDFLDTEPDIADAPDAEPLVLTGPPVVVFENVMFAYPTDEPVVVLDDVDFRVREGERVAIVGESGAGKSTLMSLIPRFYDVQAGRILLNDHDVRDMTVASLRAAIAIVPQEPILFSGTILQNIRYGDRDAGDDQIVEAAKAANADGFIREMLDGYESWVGERGEGLSGGQIQRIAIARAFLKQPQVLILDEATSNLDAHSEALVMDAIDRLAAGRTTFIIAHRLSTARQADRIIVIDRGRVVEQGTHDELVEHGGAYHDLWMRQSGAGVQETSPPE